MYVDGGSSSEILYEHGFNRLRPEVKSQMVPAITPLVGVRRIQEVPSTAHGMLKFPVPGGVLTLRSNMIIPLECAMVSGPEAQPFNAIQAVEERIKAAIHLEYLEQTITIGSNLTEQGRKALRDLLRRNLDIFAWKPADMTGVPRHIAEHRLKVREGCSPVRQKKRSQALERNKAIQEEVEKLVNAGIMKEVHYHSWLSNPVVVKKHDDCWRMCMDFKILNKACPKDGYPLPEKDWKQSWEVPWTLGLGFCKGMPGWQVIKDRILKEKIGDGAKTALHLSSSCHSF
ncbi:hypothetical protein Tco_0758949 [Tanacetum coccineum]